MFFAGAEEGDALLQVRPHGHRRGPVTRRVTFGGGVEDLQSSYSEGADGTLLVTLPPVEEAGCPSACVRPRLAEA